jgi:cell division protein FtsB
VVYSVFVLSDERREHLEQLRAEGRITEQEFANLIQASESVTASQESQSEPVVNKTLVSPKKLLLIGSAVLFVVVVVLLARPGNPLESKEYKELLDKKTALETEISSLESQLQSFPDVSEEIADYEKRVEKWGEVFTAIELEL